MTRTDDALPSWPHSVLFRVLGRGFRLCRISVGVLIGCFGLVIVLTGALPLMVGGYLCEDDGPPSGE